jgi:hypothetical protein
MNLEGWNYYKGLHRCQHWGAIWSLLNWPYADHISQTAVLMQVNVQLLVLLSQSAKTKSKRFM